MRKSTITRTWIAGLVTFAAGIVVALLGVFVMLVFGGTFTQIAGTSNYDYTPSLDGTFWSGIAVIVVGGLGIIVGGVVQVAAWIGALVNSYQLPDKAWFIVMLLGGLFGLGFAPLGLAAMVAYVVAAPEGQVERPAVQPPAPQPRGAIAPTG